MTAHEDLPDWARTRPWWQQKVSADLTAAEPVSDAERSEIAKPFLVMNR